jgi:hypothetical protein
VFIRILKLGFGLFTGIILIYIFSIGIRNIFRYNTFSLRYQNSLKEYHVEQAKNQELLTLLSRMDTNDYWIKKAREIGYQYKHERVFKVNNRKK